MTSAAPKIILYTNHSCPWAHRAHVALSELGLKYEEVIIDLSTPRTAEYLAINPRGLVPTINYNGAIIPESAIVAQFLADAHPSHLLKTSTEEGGALQRARIAFFVDTYFSKVNTGFYGVLKATEGEQKEIEGNKFIDSIVKEIEPQLQNAGPFFGGASKLTLAEVLTGSFLIRLLEFPKHEDLNLFHENFLPELEKRSPAFWKWANAVVKEKSVNYIWDGRGVAERTAARVAKMVAAAK